MITPLAHHLWAEVPMIEATPHMRWIGLYGPATVYTHPNGVRFEFWFGGEISYSPALTSDEIYYGYSSGCEIFDREILQWESYFRNTWPFHNGTTMSP